MKRFAFILGIICCMFSFNLSVLAQNTTSGQVAAFSDVPTDYWAWQEIQYSVSQNIVSGNGDGTFLPNAGVTREQFCRMLTSTFSASLSNTREQSFSDVPAEKWSYPYVEASREFLTGYANPFGGLPLFKPEDYATREDIAVALVRMMGLTDKDVMDTSYVQNHFSDYTDISPQLINYMNLACERGLMSGYPDGTLRPVKGMTRAETVVLLNRATKQAVTNISDEISLSAKAVYNNTGEEATVYIKAEEGTAITVDGETIRMENNGSGEYEGTYLYNFQEEGEKSCIIKGTKAGKTKTIEVTLTYKVSAPKLNIIQFPTSATTKQITIRGTLTDARYDKYLTINGENIQVDYDGKWEKTVTLQEGENKFIFTATNEADKTVTIEKTAVFNTSGSQLTILRCPTTATTKQVTINGTLKDSNYDVLLTINGENVRVDYEGKWEKTVTLLDGENTYTFVATNMAGKIVTEERTIQFSAGSPEISFTNCPEVTQQKYLAVQGNVGGFTDGLKLYLNDQQVSLKYDNSFSITTALEEGENSLAFRAINSYGKETSIMKTVTYISEMKAPELEVDDIPSATNEDTVEISGSVYDALDSAVVVYINDKKVSSGNGSFSTTFSLEEGINNISVNATNSYGKTTTVLKSITYQAPSTEEVEPESELEETTM
ncbi:MAG TPA: hypothetical protein DIC60_05655 [Lachnospiraceae bacterium]|nr:hypothetical protein [Lachnospiraceae bacterium]